MIQEPSHLKFTYLGQAEKLIKVLKASYLKEFSLKSIKRAIDHKAVKVNGKIELFSNAVISKSETVEFDLKKLQSPHKAIEALFEDENCLIINKPSFLTSSEKEISKALGKTLFLCHRLDKETSGVLILAKNAEALAYFEGEFENKTILKRYIALSYAKKMPSAEGTVTAPLKVVRKTEHQVKMGIHPSGLSAKTAYKITHSKGGFCLIECYPKTGRTHQIRVHLSSIGLPIVGDTLYGGISSGEGRFLLHAESIRFKPFGSLESIIVKAPLPSEFSSEIQKRL